MAFIIRNLWAKRGTLRLPGKTVPFWGFAPSAGAIPRLPGPTIEVTAGDTLFLTVWQNELAEPMSVMFPGQRDVWVIGEPWGMKRVSPQYADGRMVSFTDSLDPSAPGPITYVLNVARPGLYLYESGTSPERQVQMGLYGVVLARPPGHDTPSDPDYRTAYGAGTGTRFDLERTLILGEMDSLMHEAVGSGQEYNVLDYMPDFWVVNGRSYPDTLKDDRDPSLPSQPSGSRIVARAGQRLLLRIANAGFLNHSLYLGGLVGRVVAVDAYPLTTRALDASYERTTLTIGSGERFDVLITTDVPGEYYIRDRDYGHVVNGDVFPGGMMTVVEVAP